MVSFSEISLIVRREWSDLRLLLRSVPSLVVALFVLSVIAMNLLANKELFSCSWLALDCGFALSWVSFLCMDCICKRFGGKAAVEISVIAILINLLMFLLFRLISLTPGMWGEYYATGSLEVNEALNRTIGGSTWIVLGSALAMFVSSIINSLINTAIGRFLKGHSYRIFAWRSFPSTAVAQFADNLVFALVVSVPLFGWTMRQTLFCSLTASLFELFAEICFSGFGYRMSRMWERDQVGQAYLDRRAHHPRPSR